MTQPFIDSLADRHPAGVFDVSFEGHGWEARGWVPSRQPVTIVVMDGGREVCRGPAAEQLGRLPETKEPVNRFRFHLTVPADAVDRYSAMVLETGLSVPRRRDSDD